MARTSGDHTQSPTKCFSSPLVYSLPLGKLYAEDDSKPVSTREREQRLLRLGRILQLPTFVTNRRTHEAQVKNKNKNKNQENNKRHGQTSNLIFNPWRIQPFTRLSSEI